MKYSNKCDLKISDIPLSVRVKFAIGKDVVTKNGGHCKVLDTIEIDYSCLPNEGIFRYDHHCFVLVYNKTTKQNQSHYLANFK